MKEFSRKFVITGIIMPNNWDETGRIIEIAIHTSKEEVYAVEQNSLALELIKLIHKRVKIRGRISHHPDGNRSIAAQNYIALEEIFVHDEETN